MNVLLTSAGRRTSLLKAFRDATHSRDGLVWAGDADPLAAALQVADRRITLPRIDESDYLSAVLEHVRRNDVDLVVPTIDPGLFPLARARENFRKAGSRVLASAPSFLNLTFDKWKTIQHFAEKEIRTPTTWLPEHSDVDDWPDPVFVKSRTGSASTNAQAVAVEEVPRIINSLDSPILQEVIDAPEVTVDALFDLEGRLIHYVPRLRISTRAGESIQGRTLPDSEWQSWLRPLLRELGRLGARGPLTLQAFCTEPEPTLSEINPRFGGGFPLAFAAGGHYPDWILEMCRGNRVESRLGRYEDGLCMTRAYTEWFVEASEIGNQL